MTVLHYPPSPQSIAVDRWTAPFWAAARERRLVVCECARCSTLRMPPGPFCPQCQSNEVTWRAVTGEGRVYSYTLVTRAITPEMAASLPYAPAVIELVDAPSVRIISAIVESRLEAVAVGVPVAIAWHATPTGDVLPFFKVTQ